MRIFLVSVLLLGFMIGCGETTTKLLDNNISKDDESSEEIAPKDDGSAEELAPKDDESSEKLPPKDDESGEELAPKDDESSEKLPPKDDGSAEELAPKDDGEEEELPPKEEPLVNPLKDSNLSMNAEGTILVYQKSDFDKTVALGYDEIKELTQHIYSYFNDEYDFIFIVNDNLTLPTTVGYYGRFYSASNSVEGIGISQYNYGASFGSAGKLQGVMHFPYREGIQNGPTLHELMHNWANFIVDTGLYSHWNYTGFTNLVQGALGQLGGYDAGTLTTESGSKANGGKFSAESFGAFANGGNSLPYNDVELYLMGMIDKSEVGDVYLSTNPLYSKSETGRTYFTADKIEQKSFSTLLDDNSIVDRKPSFDNSQKSFRILTVLVNNIASTKSDVDAMNSMINWFAYQGNDTHRYYNFYEATAGMASLKIDDVNETIKDL